MIHTLCVINDINLPYKAYIFKVPNGINIPGENRTLTDFKLEIDKQTLEVSIYTAFLNKWIKYDKANEYMNLAEIIFECHKQEKKNLCIQLTSFQLKHKKELQEISI